MVILNKTNTVKKLCKSYSITANAGKKSVWPLRVDKNVSRQITIVIMKKSDKGLQNFQHD